MSYLVTNVAGSSSRAALPSGYTSWIDFWEKKTGLKANYCKETSCINMATDGAHVQVSGQGDYWYIVPLCHRHNMSMGYFYVEGPLVPVNTNLPILW